MASDSDTTYMSMVDANLISTEMSNQENLWVYPMDVVAGTVGMVIVV